MPQMGESIAEGTITKWLKQVGDHVDRDEPLFEISTDKVDAEIPAPAAGTLTEIKFKEGETVEVNTVVAVLDGESAKPAAEAAAAPEQETPPPVPEPAPVETKPEEAPVTIEPPKPVIPPAPAAKPAKANNPIAKDNIRACFMAITYAELAKVVE
jgi:2-oxoglutarate dehydrogenase E2 component (dihydrolipoamide succinyltransferase)